MGIVVEKRRARRQSVRLRSAVEERAVLGVSGGVGGHERALRDHSFTIASQRFEDAMRQSRSVSQAGQLLRHLRVEQDDPAVLDLVVGDCERTVPQGHFKPAHGWIVPDVALHFCLPHSSAPDPGRPDCEGLPVTAASSAASRVSGRTVTDCGLPRALRRTAYATATITFASHQTNAPILTPHIPAMIAAATMALIATHTPQKRSA
jgi:hypothetical protein